MKTETDPKIRNKRYILSELSPGDRFYFYGDRKKQVFQLDRLKPFETVIQKGFKIKYANCYKSGQEYTVVTERHKADRFVIFLRNVNDKNYDN